MSITEMVYRMCKDEYESYYIYRFLSRSPTIDKKLRDTLARAADDEYRHYMFWQSIAGGCKSRVSLIKVLLYVVIFYLFGLTITLKILESKEANAEHLYKSIPVLDPNLSNAVTKIAEEELRHEKEFLLGIDEGRVKYIGSITLGISDALVELTGIYAGSLGAFENAISAGLTGLLAGIAASISMGIASYSQAKHEKRLNPRLSALYTSLAYIVVVLLLSVPYFVINSTHVAFAVMIAIAIGVLAYISFYAAVLQNKKYLREFAESTTLILGVSLLLYVVGSWLGGMLGVRLAD